MAKTLRVLALMSDSKWLRNHSDSDSDSNSDSVLQKVIWPSQKRRLTTEQHCNFQLQLQISSLLAAWPGLAWPSLASTSDLDLAYFACGCRNWDSSSFNFNFNIQQKLWSHIHQFVLGQCQLDFDFGECTARNWCSFQPTKHFALIRAHFLMRDVCSMSAISLYPLAFSNPSLSPVSLFGVLSLQEPRGSVIPSVTCKVPSFAFVRMAMSRWQIWMRMRMRIRMQWQWRTLTLPSALHRGIKTLGICPALGPSN